MPVITGLLQDVDSIAAGRRHRRHQLGFSTGGVYSTSDGGGGAYRICLRYFLDAAEGHGTRFRTMPETPAILN